MRSTFPFLSFWFHFSIIDEVSSFSLNELPRRITRSSLSSDKQNEDESMNENSCVRVYENAFSQDSCEMLHYLSIEHYERTNDGSSFFTRPPHNERPLTPIENAIDSALIELGDKTKRVEYWSRDEYMNIDAHADIDEAMLEDEGLVRCPSVGHVLYLQVKPGLRGPTCIFPKEQRGWGLNETGNNGNEKELVVVPAVEGRLLRFPGSAMHAVPNPPDRWLLSRQGEKAPRDEEEKYKIEENEDDEWEEDDYDDDEEIERSVLLFNTWPDDEPGPRGVNGDIATGALPEGIEISEEDAAAYLKSQEAEILREWEDEYGENGNEVRCNPWAKWTALDIKTFDSETESADDKPAIIRVSLMGRENRRLYPKQYAKLEGARTLIGNAMMEDSTVTSNIVRSV